MKSFCESSHWLQVNYLTQCLTSRIVVQRLDDLGLSLGHSTAAEVGRILLR